MARASRRLHRFYRAWSRFEASSQIIKIILVEFVRRNILFLKSQNEINFNFYGCTHHIVTRISPV